MRRLHKRFPDELVILGIHSAKFPAERVSGNIEAAARRHGIEHLVANDDGFRVWNAYAVRAWPTVVLIDPEGYVVAQLAGEIDAAELERDLEERLEAARAAGRLASQPLELPLRSLETSGPLRFPSKLLVAGDRLFVADTAHHRVLELEPDREHGAARLLRSFGGGERGFVDGPAAVAAFDNPHGLALWRGSLYVADTDNHAVRRIDLASGEVSTVAGTGEKSRRMPRAASDARAIALRSPWALAPLEDQALLVAMAGSHQIWVLLADGGAGPLTGSGREALVDGPRESASFNQPSDLALAGAHLFVADSEASAVRAVDLAGGARVVTLVGQGLFEFGDQDGRGEEVRLQHPTGLALGDGLLYLADSYNHKVKTLDPVTGEVRTLIGNGEAGLEDGPFATARLYEPEGLAYSQGLLWIADTNNHAIRLADLARGELSTLRLELGARGEQLRGEDHAAL